MKINRIRIDKTVDYPTSFYKRLKEEQKQFKAKTNTRPKEENNYVNEEDSVSALNSLSYTEPKYKLPGKIVKKKIKIADKRLLKVNSGKVIAQKLSSEKDNTENEICVIEEIDCKQTLFSIGYGETGEEEDTEVFIETEIEDEIEEQSEGTAEEDTQNTIAELQSADDHLNKSVEIPEYNINNYFSTIIIDTVVLYNDKKDDICEVADEKQEEVIIYNDDNIVSDILDENKIIDEDKMTDENNIADEINNADKCNINNGCNSDMVHKERKNKYRIINQMKVKLSFEFGNLKKILHLDDVHIKNKLGFVSLLSLFGLLGIFTVNKAYLGFFAFLYYARYLFVLPDEIFKDNVLKAAAPALFTSIVISLMTIILEVLFKNTKLLILGMGIGTVIPILVFTINLAIYQMRKDKGNDL